MGAEVGARAVGNEGVQTIAWWWSRRKLGWVVGGVQEAGFQNGRVEDGLKQEPGKGRAGITTSGTRSGGPGV